MAVNRAALQRRLSGVKDSRGPVGIFSRGKNIYRGGSSAARRGGGYNIGRPTKTSLERRMKGRNGTQ